jgi:predicted enzyme related to lactoylglutathione lyase
MESITFYVDDLETARQTASAHGVEVPPALTEILGNHVFMIQDPDGTKIEFNKRP